MASHLPFPTAMAEHWMYQAFELAQSAASQDEVPIGALLVKDNEIIGFGANSRERTRRTVAHAEIMALEDFGRRTGEWRVPAETSLFVTAEPCLMCTGALLWARVDNVFYGCSDPRHAGIEKTLTFIRQGTYDHRFQEVRGGILADSCSQLLSGYFRTKRQNRPPQTLELPS